MNVVLSRILVLAKHRVDGFLKLDSIGFIDTVGVYPEVLQVVTPCLFSIELYLTITSLLLVVTVLQIC